MDAVVVFFTGAAFALPARTFFAGGTAFFAAAGFALATGFFAGADAAVLDFVVVAVLVVVLLAEAVVLLLAAGALAFVVVVFATGFVGAFFCAMSLGLAAATLGFTAGLFLESILNT